MTHTKTNAKCFKDPMYVIFLKSREFKVFKYDMDMNMSDINVMDMDLVDTNTNTKTKTNTQTKTNTKCFKYLMYVIFFKNLAVMDMDVVDTKTQTKTNTKCFKDPMYVVFLKSREIKDFKYDMDINISDMAVIDMDAVDTKTKTNTMCIKDPMYAIFLKSRGSRISNMTFYIVLVNQVETQPGFVFSMMLCQTRFSYRCQTQSLARYKDHVGLKRSISRLTFEISVMM